jgi:hypothetical protein
VIDDSNRLKLWADTTFTSLLLQFVSLLFVNLLINNYKLLHIIALLSYLFVRYQERSAMLMSRSICNIPRIKFSWF